MTRAARARALVTLLGGSLAGCSTTAAPGTATDAAIEAGDATSSGDARDAADATHDGAGACDVGGACCCDIDVLVDPTCADGGLVCPSMYVLLPASACGKCVRVEPDAAGGG
jgi:hypothetical protein